MVTSESDHEVIVQWSLTSDRHSVSTAMSELLARDLRPELSKIKAPTLVLLSYAAFKPMLNRAMIEGMGGFQYQTLPGVKIAVHDEARHFIMLDAPDWFFGQVDAFLAQR